MFGATVVNWVADSLAVSSSMVSNHKGAVLVSGYLCQKVLISLQSQWFLLYSICGQRKD